MNYLVAGAVSGFLVVALGAFGAHGLAERLGADMMAVYRTGVDYHMFHSLALLAVGILQLQSVSPALLWAGRLFTIGIVVFSGSLYLLAVTGSRELGMITPLGGLAFLAGWVMLAFAARGIHRMG